MIYRINYNSHDYGLSDIAENINEAFEAFAAFLQVAYTGNYQNIEIFKPNASHINNVFKKFYAYAVLGDFPDDASIDDFYDATAFIINARINCELFGKDVPTALESLMAKAFVCCKLDAALGLPCFDTEDLRWAYENNESPDLTIQEIATLVGMDLQSVRNAMQGDHFQIDDTYKNKDGQLLIPIKGAIDWIKTREKYTPRKPPKAAIPEGHILVPVAKDGSIFGYSCKQTAGFKIGKKGEERYIETAEMALEELRKMKTAYWRRPNHNGRFGIVKANGDWKVISLAEFRKK